MWIGKYVYFLLSIIYINDIVEGLESEILIYADDCSLLACGSYSAETAEQTWKIIFNAGKSKDITFSNNC